MANMKQIKPGDFLRIEVKVETVRPKDGWGPGSVQCSFLNNPNSGMILLEKEVEKAEHIPNAKRFNRGDKVLISSMMDREEKPLEGIVIGTGYLAPGYVWVSTGPFKENYQIWASELELIEDANITEGNISSNALRTPNRQTS